MTEEKYLTKIGVLWPTDKSRSQWAENKPLNPELLATVEDALREYPQSSQLWCIRGDLLYLQTRPWDPGLNLDLCVESYRKAGALDETNWYAWESIAGLFDAYEVDFAEAERLFSRAISLGAEEHSYAGRARVLAELGRREEALQQLSPEECPYADSPEIAELRKEIVAGEWDRVPDLEDQAEL